MINLFLPHSDVIPGPELVPEVPRALPAWGGLVVLVVLDQLPAPETQGAGTSPPDIRGLGQLLINICAFF